MKIMNLSALRLGSLPVILAATAVLSLSSCSKPEEYISYPSGGIYGDNLLALPDNSTINAGDLSMTAIIPEGCKLTVTISDANPEGTGTFYPSVLEEDGWNPSAYNTAEEKQVFVAQDKRSPDVKMYFRHGVYKLTLKEEGNLNKTTEKTLTVN